MRIYTLTTDDNSGTQTRVFDKEDALERALDAWLFSHWDKDILGDKPNSLMLALKAYMDADMENTVSISHHTIVGHSTMSLSHMTHMTPEFDEYELEMVARCLRAINQTSQMDADQIRACVATQWYKGGCSNLSTGGWVAYLENPRAEKPKFRVALTPYSVELYLANKELDEETEEECDPTS